MHPTEVVSTTNNNGGTRNGSAFYPLLQSNAIPTTEECESVKASIRQQESQISAISGALTSLRKFMEQLETQQIAISESIVRKRHYLSSIRRLPVEILQEIFLYCNPNERVEISRPQRNLWDLGQVCSQWRAALSSMRNIWRRLYIELNFGIKLRAWVDSGAGYAVINQRIRTCLVRAGELPISISFLPGSGVDWCTLANVLDTLGEYSGRWEDFNAPLGSWSLRHVQILFGKKAEALKSVHIEGYNYEGRVLGFFSSTPLLSYLSLSCVRHPTQTIFPVVGSCKNITTFISAENMFLPGEILRVLRFLPNLEHFETNYDHGVEAGTLGDQRGVELPHLRCLQLRAGTMASFMLLDYLVSPHLSQIDLILKVPWRSAKDEAETHCAQTIVAFIRRASGLRHLTLGYIPEYFVEELLPGIDPGCIVQLFNTEVSSTKLQTLLREYRVQVTIETRDLSVTKRSLRRTLL